MKGLCLLCHCVDSGQQGARLWWGRWGPYCPLAATPDKAVMESLPFHHTHYSSPAFYPLLPLAPPCTSSLLLAFQGEASGSNFCRNFPFSSSLPAFSQVRLLINVCDCHDAAAMSGSSNSCVFLPWSPTNALLLYPIYRWEDWGKAIM